MSISNSPSSQAVVLSRRAACQNDQSAAVKDLEGTIARFQAILTDDDRKELHQLKAEPHDAQSIIMFTASLDRFDPKRRGKSVASRLASFLQTIEQFTPIVDTYIQSNPEIAALVWGSVKLTFQLLANFTSYFQSFVELLPGFGSLCSRFAEYQVIFKDSPRLKTSICAFHSSVINCCEKIVLVTRRPMKSQAWMAITQSFQGEIQSYVDDIKSKAETVRDDIQLAKFQSDHNEQQQQSKARQKAEENHSLISSWLAKTRSEMRLIGDHDIRGTEDQRRRRLLKDLSSHNYISAFNNARNKRHLGTAEWAFKTDQFQNWLAGEGSAVLHVTGKIGSGKTILASSIVEHLCQVRHPNQFISFFFSRFDSPTTLASETIIRSLVQQLLSVAPMDMMEPVLASEIANRLQKAQDDFFSLDSLRELYESASKFTQDWFIVLDGIDECVVEQQRLVLDFLSRFLRNCSGPQGIRIVFSSRETAKKDIEGSFATVERLITGTSDTSADIIAFAEDVIVTKLSRGELVVRDPNIIGDILNAIASKEDGMFLWAFLAIEDICSGTNDKEIRQALRDIPTDLPTTFDRALSRILQRRNQKIAKEIFGWTTAAHQPLTLTQLEEALSVKVGQRNLHPDDLVSGMDRIAVWCENLVCVEETDNTVHFSHHSIREYLLQPGSGDLKDFHVDLEAFDRHVGAVCITYLNLENLKSALIEREKPEAPPAVTVSMEGLTERTVRAAVGGSMGVRIGRWTNRVVKSSARSAQPSTGDGAIQSTLGHLRYKPPARKGIEYAFLEYAEGNWFRHKARLDRGPDRADGTMGNLACRLLRSSRQREDLPWKDLAWRDSITKQASSFSDRADPAGFFLPPEMRGPAYPAGHHMTDLSPIGSLPFLAVYAIHNNHDGLACCAFMTFLEERPRSHVTRWLTMFLALRGKHTSCPNGCLARLHRYLDHEELVKTVTLCIAAGVSHWPAPMDDGSVLVFPCNCSETRFHDFCKLVTNGYNAEEHVYLQNFAQLAMCKYTKPSASGPLHNWMDIALLDARTSKNMSILDVAAEQGDKASTDFMRSFLGKIDLGKAHLEQPTMKKISLGGLCTALRSGARGNVELLVDHCNNIFSREGVNQCEPLEIIYSHLALADAAKFDWPSDTIKLALVWYFELVVVEREREAKVNNLIEESIKYDNWRFAADVVDVSLALKIEKQENDDPFLGVTLDALSCQRCRGRQTWPEIVEHLSGTLLLADQDYKLCSKHRRQALAKLDPGLYMMPNRGALRLAYLGEAAQAAMGLQPKDGSDGNESVRAEFDGSET